MFNIYRWRRWAALFVQRYAHAREGIGAFLNAGNKEPVTAKRFFYVGRYDGYEIKTPDLINEINGDWRRR
jgi:hypothetical protein